MNIYIFFQFRFSTVFYQWSTLLFAWFRNSFSQCTYVSTLCIVEVIYANKASGITGNKIRFLIGLIFKNFFTKRSEKKILDLRHFRFDFKIKSTNIYKDLEQKFARKLSGLSLLLIHESCVITSCFKLKWFAFQLEIRN